MNRALQNKIQAMMSQTKATYLDSKTLYKGKFIDLIEENYSLPNQVIMRRERIVKNHQKDAVIIVARTKDDRYLLVSQNRINQMTTLEFPSGYVEPQESIMEASKRELLEETGYTCEDVEILDSYYAQLGIDSSLVFIVLATSCEKKQEQNLGKYEYILYDTFSYDELRELIQRQYILGVGNKLAFYELNYKRPEMTRTLKR